MRRPNNLSRENAYSAPRLKGHTCLSWAQRGILFFSFSFPFFLVKKLRPHTHTHSHTQKRHVHNIYIKRCVQCTHIHMYMYVPLYIHIYICICTIIIVYLWDLIYFICLFAHILFFLLPAPPFSTEPAHAFFSFSPHKHERISLANKNMWRPVCVCVRACAGCDWLVAWWKSLLCFVCVCVCVWPTSIIIIIKRTRSYSGGILRIFLLLLRIYIIYTGYNSLYTEQQQQQRTLQSIRHFPAKPQWWRMDLDSLVDLSVYTQFIYFFLYTLCLPSVVPLSFIRRCPKLCVHHVLYHHPPLLPYCFLINGLP